MLGGEGRAAPQQGRHHADDVAPHSIMPAEDEAKLLFGLDVGRFSRETRAVPIEGDGGDVGRGFWPVDPGDRLHAVDCVIQGGSVRKSDPA